LKRREGALIKVANPFRGWTQRFAFGLLLAVSLALMLLGKADSSAIERLRVEVSDFVAPALSLVAEPVATVRGTLSQFDSYKSLQAQNVQLREQNDLLLQWQSAAQALQAENRRLRALLDAAADPYINSAVGRVIADNRGAFAHTLLVAAGLRDGVDRNQAAMAPSGLVGRVMEVGDRSARVLLVTDINSRIPVMLQGQRQRAVLAGANGQRLKLLYLEPDAPREIGERIVTSGLGGVFPPGLAIGRIVEVTPEATWVEPYVNWSDLEYLRLLDYRVDSSLVSKGFEESLENAVLSPGAGDSLIEERVSGNPGAPRP
jgi:rod shape-determining protein MreC